MKNRGLRLESLSWEECNDEETTRSDAGAGSMRNVVPGAECNSPGGMIAPSNMDFVPDTRCQCDVGRDRE